MVYVATRVADIDTGHDYSTISAARKLRKKSVAYSTYSSENKRSRLPCVDEIHRCFVSR